ncbi:CLL_collapsed_G0029230.mRNA.1.CDS.1 [Saccharomyces cerevisiae]|nr:CLL_collapsed_G0029230.mRNA.1.CDS.1 [Saccharomyces cerevisiae]
MVLLLQSASGTTTASSSTTSRPYSDTTSSSLVPLLEAYLEHCCFFFQYYFFSLSRFCLHSSTEYQRTLLLTRHLRLFMWFLLFGGTHCQSVTSSSVNSVKFANTTVFSAQTTSSVSASLSSSVAADDIQGSTSKEARSSVSEHTSIVTSATNAAQYAAGLELKCSEDFFRPSLPPQLCRNLL